MIRKIARLPFKIVKTLLSAVRDGGREQPMPSEIPRSQPIRRPHTEAPPDPTPQEDDHDDGHDHGHSHDHDHGHGGEPDPEPVSVQMETTPNPNAMKFGTSITLCSQGSKSWGSKEEAAGDPLGEALFNIPGVASVFIVNDFVTVTKQAQIDWGGLTHPITEAIELHAKPA